MSDRIHGAGGEVIAISVDSDDRNAAMFQRWPTPHITYVSDPGGTRFLQPLDLFDPDERDGIALPGLLVIAPDGREVSRYRGADFADRRNDDDVVDALESLRLDAIDPPPGGPVDPTVSVDQPGVFRPDQYSAYFRGNRTAAHAIFRRLTDSESKSLAREHRLMCDAMLTAWDQVRPRRSDA